VLSKTLKLTMVHHAGPGITTLEGSMAFDHHNKATVKHNFAKSGPLLKYEYSKEKLLRRASVRPRSWVQLGLGLAIKKGLGKNFLKCAYFHHRHEVELEMQHMIKGGPLKVTPKPCEP